MTPTPSTSTIAAQIEALAPCPFCGGEARLFSVSFPLHADVADIQVSCSNCDAIGPSTMYEYGVHTDGDLPALEGEAISAWNTRPAIVTALGQAEGPTQPCDRCGKLVKVNAVSPSECFCSAECADPETDRQAEAAPGVVEALEKCRAFIATLKAEGAEQLSEGVHAGLRKGSSADDAGALWSAISRSETTAWSDAIEFGLDPFFSMWGGDDALKAADEALARQHGAREDGWQTIESAPTNRAIQVHIPDADYYGNGGIYAAMLVDMGTGRRWMTFGHNVGRDCSPEAQPMAWRYLPAAPATDAGEG